MIEQLWAMEAGALREFWGYEAKAGHFAAPDVAVEDEELPFEVVAGIAKIRLKGTLLTDPPWWARYFGDVANPDAIIEQIEAADARADVESIELVVNSPGGSAQAGARLAEYLAGWQGKPIDASVSTLAASAAYWVIVACREIRAAKTAEIGSIGVYAVIRDTAELYKSEGVRVHLLKSGEHKGVGTAGVPIEAEQLAHIQERVDTLAGYFFAAVREGRAGVAEEVFDGRVFFGEKALELGLIDTIMEATMGKSDIGAAQVQAPVAPAATAAPVAPAAPAATATPQVAAEVAQLRDAQDQLVAENLKLQDQLAALREEQAALRAAALLAEARAAGVPERYFAEDSPLVELAAGKCADPRAVFGWFSSELAKRAVVPPTEAQGGGDEDPQSPDPQQALAALARKKFRADQENGGVLYRGDYKAAVRAARKEVAP